MFNFSIANKAKLCCRSLPSPRPIVAVQYVHPSMKAQFVWVKVPIESLIYYSRLLVIRSPIFCSIIHAIDNRHAVKLLRHKDILLQNKSWIETLFPKSKISTLSFASTLELPLFIMNERINEVQEIKEHQKVSFVRLPTLGLRTNNFNFPSVKFHFPKTNLN